MKKFLPVASLFLVACVFAGCAASDTASIPRTVAVTKSTNGGMITLNKGDALTVTLDGNPTTGYRWEYIAGKEAILSLQGDPQFKPASSAIGSPGEVTFNFKARQSGSQSLELVYGRSFEKDQPPLAAYKAKVMVR
ncbi:MAG: protease inhibitor I42 family protein [Puniceicoccales bacterium]|nr:protease inhibitor I42 family protein [Puniceicoccales bacterium]